MEQKKTISELYQECKHEQEIKQQLEYLLEYIRETTELFKKQIAEDLFCDPVVRFCPPPIPPIPQSFQGKL